MMDSSVYMIWKEGRVQMPKDTHLGLFEACFRADVYKKQNGKNVYQVVNNETGDIEYEI